MEARTATTGHLPRIRTCRLQKATFHFPEPYFLVLMKLHNLTLLLPAALILTSCGTFERDWEQSVAEYKAGKVSSPAGPWTGTWDTRTNGHSGNLRAIVTPSGNGDGQYDFRYHATWAKILSGTYTVRFPVKRSGSGYTANGEKNLGPFGTFGHRAKIRGNQFRATYSSDKGDLGSFLLQRPE